MNKILLVLSVCSLITIMPAFADCNCTPACNCQKASCQKMPYDDLRFYKNFADQVKKERSAVSNALQLTEEQAKCRVELIRKNSSLLEEKFRDLYNENIKLRTLNAEKASHEMLKTQQAKVNCVKEEIKQIIDNENKEFKKILDREQRSKLNMIQKLQRKSVKSCKKQKNYYKSNPKMRPFAMPKNLNCGCDKK